MKDLDLPHVASFEGRSVAWGCLGDGPPIVLIHGTPFSAQVWRRIAPHLAATRRVYYFDLLGYGRSAQTADGDVSLGVQNRLLAFLLAHWAIDRPSILCHDFGAATALRGHYLDGLRYRDLTLFDGVVLSPWGSPFVTHVRHHEAAFAGVPDYIHDALLAAYLQTAAHTVLPPATIDLYSRPWRGPVGKPAFYRQIAQMDQRYTEEIEGALGPLGCPTQILWGAQDGWLPADQGRRLADRLTAGALTLVPDAGHLVQDDAPEAIVAAVLNPPWQR